MKNVQDTLRKRQSLLISFVITLVCLILFVAFIYQKRQSQVNEGMNALIAHMHTVFNDNELIADATGVRFQQIRASSECGALTDFSQRSDGAWVINGMKNSLNPDIGALVSRTADRHARCMFAAAEFIRSKINTLNPGRFDAHRYIISADADWFYWFEPKDSLPFHFSDSRMAQTPEVFLQRPVSFYDRLLNKSVQAKAANATNFYIDRISGETAYSIVSYIYDLSGAGVSDRIVGYLLYDHSRQELREAMMAAFDGKIPVALRVELVNLSTRETLCLTNSCVFLGDTREREASDKYQFRFALPPYLFAIYDPVTSRTIMLSPLIFLLLAMFLRRQLNRSDITLFSDPLTGCFTRKILPLVRARAADYAMVVLMDCNKFKVINDTWGHGVGDRALQIIAHQMISCIRDGKDLVIRSGGDEFILLLNHLSSDEAWALAQRIAESIRQQTFTVGGDTIPLSVSWGVAAFQGDIDATIQQADNDMYRMKQARQDAASMR